MYNFTSILSLKNSGHPIEVSRERKLDICVHERFTCFYEVPKHAQFDYVAGLMPKPVFVHLHNTSRYLNYPNMIYLPTFSR